MSAPNPTEYWAAKADSDEFSKEAMSRMSHDSLTPISSYAGYRRNLELAYIHYFASQGSGFGPQGSQVTRGGEQGELAELRVNLIRSHINAKLQIIVAPQLAWSCSAVNSDAKSMADATLGANVLEFEWKQKGYQARCSSAVLDAIKYGEHFLYDPWDKSIGRAAMALGGVPVPEGDIASHSVATWDLLRDPHAKSYEASDWLCPRIWVNKFDLVAKIQAAVTKTPEQKEALVEKVLAVNSEFLDFSPVGLARGDVQLTNTDFVPLYCFHHKRTPAVPKGRLCLFLKAGVVLEDGPLPDCYADPFPLPIHRMHTGNLDGTPFPYTDTWDAMATQELMDSVQTSLATNIGAYGNQIISAESNQNLPVDQLASGPKILYRPPGSQPPVALNFRPAPDSHFKHLDHLRADQRQILGLNDISMGQPQTAQMNAQAFALLASMAIQQNSLAQANYVAFVQRIGRSHLAIFKEMATTERKITIQGTHGPTDYQSLSFSGPKLGAVDDAYVTITDPISQTAAGRMMLAQMYSDRGMIQVPEQLQAVIETGKLEPLTQNLRNELLYIADENEHLQKGDCPAVTLYDSHQIHLREHKGVLHSMEARNDKRIGEAVYTHMQEHLNILLNTNPQILMAIGQALPMPMMPPPGGPPGAPAGGAPPPPGTAGQTPIPAAQPKEQLPKNPVSGQTFSPVEPPIK